jgi:putative ABC transport system substrate-binding protein
MKRREFLAVAAVCLSKAALAQSTTMPLRVAILRAPALADSVRETEAFRDGLRGAGLLEGRDIVLEIRSAEGLPAALPRLAEELAKLYPAVFVVGGTVAVHAARAAAPSVPVVALIGDFSAAGWATEFARPGAGVPGVSFESNNLDPKRMELLSEVLPKHSAILNLGDGSSRNVTEPALREAALSLGLTAHTVDARTTREIETAFDTARKLGIAGINVLSSPFLNANRRRIIELAAGSKLPAIYQWPESAEDGGFMAYGPRLSAMYRQMAGMVAKIIRGARPQDIPVEQPTKFDLVINIKAAKTLGITIPQSLLLRADVVE